MHQNRVELFSGRVKKVKPTEVGEQRYQFLKLSEAEPDLGVPATTDSSDVKRILLTDNDGTRYWSDTLQIDDTGDLLATGEIQADKFSTDALTVTDTAINTKNPGEDITLGTENGGLVRFNSAMGVQIGQPDAGALISRAVSMTTSTPIARGVAQMNFILGKLVPKPPPDFPKLANGDAQTLVVQNLTTFRMCDFTQTDNTPSSRNVTAGFTTSRVLRTNIYVTNYITGCGPGNTGTVAVYKNGVQAGSRAMTDDLLNADNELGANYLIGTDNGLYSDLQIANDRDYSLIASPAIAALFWQSFDARATGTVTQGWNEVYIDHTGAGTTNTAYWYYDASSPGTPQFTSTSFTPPVSPTYTYSSSIPHYSTANSFTLSFNVNRLSGDMYPTSDNFITGASGGAFNAPTTLTYATASITTPLARNLYVASGSAVLTTTAQIKTGFGSNSGTVSLTCNNSYAIGTQTFSPGATVLYKTGTSTAVDETNIVIGAVGSGSGNGVRIVNPGSTDTPSFSANATAFDSKDSTLQTYDAVVVGSGSQGLLKHDQTDYSSGYLPVGPNLSVGRSGAQYFTFKFVRQAVSKFNISFTGNIAGLWVALPGSTFGNTSTLNGWLRMDQAYAGAGAPGANTAQGGNGSNGCALGGVVVLNSNGTQSRTCTFGTVSSTSTATNEIYVRIRLNSGQSVTALSIVGATN